MSDEKVLPTPLLDLPASTLLAEFGAGKAAPGSGSAAALMGLLSARLLATVCKKSLTKPECRTNHAQLRALLEMVERELEPALRRLFEEDSAEFAHIVEIRIARDVESDPEERARLERRANDMLERATDRIFDLSRICSRLIDYGIAAFEIGWPSVKGDSGAAISAAVSGVMSTIFVASLNLKVLRKRRYARENVERCREMHRDLNTKQVRAFGCVTSLESEAILAIQLELPEAQGSSEQAESGKD